jgi:membrane protein DedA with SNARE-associated domain
MAWLVRGLLVLAGIVASWWVAEDEPVFPVVQMVIVVVLIVFALLIAEVWLPRWRERLSNRKLP